MNSFPKKRSRHSDRTSKLIRLLLDVVENADGDLGLQGCGLRLAANQGK